MPLKSLRSALSRVLPSHPIVSCSRFEKSRFSRFFFSVWGFKKSILGFLNITFGKALLGVAYKILFSEKKNCEI